MKLGSIAAYALRYANAHYVTERPAGSKALSGAAEQAKREGAEFVQAVVDQRQTTVATLLDAIKGLIDWIEIDHLPMDKDALQIARAAIAKAEGAETHG